MFPSRVSGTGDWKVAGTRRQECPRYMTRISHPQPEGGAAKNSIRHTCSSGFFCRLARAEVLLMYLSDNVFFVNSIIDKVSTIHGWSFWVGQAN
jgi:hypothetical protein